MATTKYQNKTPEQKKKERDQLRKELFPNFDPLDVVEIKITCGCGYITEGPKNFVLVDYEEHVLTSPNHLNQKKQPDALNSRQG